MQPFQRPQFICSAIEKCQETVNCCPHKTPHIKDERCVPRECRYAPGVERIDCVVYDPEKPSVLVPLEPATKIIEETRYAIEMAIEKEKAAKERDTNEPDNMEESEKSVSQEENIKQAVRMRAARPNTIRKAKKKVS